MVKVPDYNAESRGFETLPSDIYLFENFLAADSSGCLFCHNLDEDIPVLAVETRAGDALEAASPAEAPLGELTAQEIILCQAEDAFCMAFPPKMDTPLIRCTTTPLKGPSESGTMWTKRTNADRSGAPEFACKDISCPSRGRGRGFALDDHVGAPPP